MKHEKQRLGLRWIKSVAMAAIISNPPVAAAECVEVLSSPKRVLIEETETAQRLNLDFYIENRSCAKLELQSIQLSVYDRQGRLGFRRDVDGSGGAPAVDVMGPDREFAPGAKGLTFNPFSELSRDLELSRLEYRLEFTEASTDKRIVVTTSVNPERYSGKARLKLPLDGRIWVKHGHDFFSSHRRWNPLHPLAVRLFGPTGNFERYALDLMIVDVDGNARRGKSGTNEDFYGWGQPVFAAAAGTVVAAYSDDIDDDIATDKTGFDPERLSATPMHNYGNYVVIDHGQGEFSLAGHLQRQSVGVKVGQRVGEGQQIGRVGMSGSAEFEPHVHFELRTGTAIRDVEGLPAYFHDFQRVLGERVVTVRKAPVDAGDIVINTVSGSSAR
jgi:murein DD-endopeptidase MepM/ murein hydrolase activator NlpD